MKNRRLRHAFFHRWLSAHDIRFFNPPAMLLDLGGTAKNRNFAHARAHRRPVHGSLAFELFQVHRLEQYLQNFLFISAEIVEARMPGPLNDRPHARSHLPFFEPLPHFSPGRRGAGSSKSTGPPLEWCESHFQTAESNLGALSTLDLGPKRPFSVGECALWARFTGPQFAAVVKEVITIKYGNTTGHSTKSSSSRPSPANTSSPFQRAPRQRRPRR